MRVCVERHMAQWFQHLEALESRKQKLIETMEEMKLPAVARAQMLAKLEREEAEEARRKRKKRSIADFKVIAVVGRGAFGEVRQETGEFQRAIGSRQWRRAGDGEPVDRKVSKGGGCALGFA